MARYIFITGGVVSSLGKGLASAALGALLQARGYKVRLRKLDPYLNVDPGTMSPYQHGEVFVTDDGAETDLDLGHYERFTGVSATRNDNVTTGQIYKTIIEKERRGDYPGRHRPGDPPRHRRDQTLRPGRSGRGRRLRAGRDRRHGGRHRGPAVLRGDPPTRPGTAAPPRLLRAPHAAAVHQDGRGDEDQADPALGARAALHRHPARHAAVPLRAADPAGRAAQDRPFLQRAAERGDPGAGRAQRSMPCRWPTTARGWTAEVLDVFGMAESAPAPDLSRWRTSISERMAIRTAR